ncbi:MAG: hypothetical protein M5U26_07325 [Planctomycetota bacterium]|nr:hypothetical protein [Planctomycetota bacterium]
MPLDAPEAEEVPHDGPAILGHFFGWILGVGLLGVALAAGAAAILNQGLGVEGRNLDYVLVGALVLAGLAGLFAAVRKTRKSLSLRRKIAAFEKQLDAAMYRPVQAFECAPLAAYWLCGESGRNEDEYLLDLGEGRLLYVRDPKRFGLRPEIPADASRIETPNPHGNPFPSTSFTAFACPSTGVALGILSEGDALTPKRLKLPGEDYERLPVDLGLVEARLATLSGAAGTGAQGSPNAVRLALAQARATRKRVTKRLLLYAGLVLALMLAGFLLGRPKQATVSEALNALGDGASVERFVLKGSVEQMGQATFQYFDADTGAFVQPRRIVLADATGKTELVYLPDALHGASALWPGAQVKIRLTKRRVKLGQGSDGVEFLFAARIDVEP